jgi:hypothetical protein
MQQTGSPPLGFPDAPATRRRASLPTAAHASAGLIVLACQDCRAVLAGTAGVALTSECFSAVVAGAR